MAKGKPFFIEKEKLEELYQKHQTLGGVARELGVTNTPIRNSMKKYGLEWTPRRINTCNENFFSGDSPEEMYWAGMLLTDGCLYIISKHAYPSYRIVLGLSNKDIGHIEKFKKAVNSTADIHTYPYKKGPNSIIKSNEQFLQSSIVVTSKQMFENLAKYNVVPNKTYICSFPEWIRHHPNCNHFVRGLIDGDGFYKMDTKRKQLTLGLCGMPALLMTVKEVLNEVICKDVGTIRLQKEGGKVHDLRYAGTQTFKAITDWLYQNAHEGIYLDRKKISKDEILANSLLHKFEGDNFYALEDLTKENLLAAYEKHKSLRGMMKELGHQRDIIKRYIKRYGLNLSFTKVNQFG